MTFLWNKQHIVILLKMLKKLHLPVICGSARNRSGFKHQRGGTSSRPDLPAEVMQMIWLHRSCLVSSYIHLRLCIDLGRRIWFVITMEFLETEKYMYLNHICSLLHSQNGWCIQYGQAYHRVQKLTRVQKLAVVNSSSSMSLALAHS